MRSRVSRVEGRKLTNRVLWLSLVYSALSATAQEELPKLQPPMGEIPPTFWEQYGTTVLVSVPVAMLMLALGIWLLLRPKPVVVLPPEVQARRALDALLHEAEDGNVISRVSQILRHYVQAVFQLPAGEPTTTEFCQLIAGRSDIGEELARALADFLRQCDERKFARANPPSPIGATARALELLAQGEARRAQLRQQESAQVARPAVASA
jgi:hypothetical protein